MSLDFGPPFVAAPANAGTGSEEAGVAVGSIAFSLIGPSGMTVRAEPSRALSEMMSFSLRIFLSPFFL